MASDEMARRQSILSRWDWLLPGMMHWWNVHSLLPVMRHVPRTILHGRTGASDSISACRFGHLTSISSVILDGGVARKPMVRIRISPPRWAWLWYEVCRVHRAMRVLNMAVRDNIASCWHVPSTLRCIAALSITAIVSILNCFPSVTCGKLICLLSRLWCRREMCRR